MILPIITAFYAALLSLSYVGLSLRIPILRTRHQVGLGDGEVPELARWVRVHGNFAEYVPLALTLMLLLEILGTSHWLLHITGITLVIARGLHAKGLSRSGGATQERFIGTVFTLSLIGLMSLLLLTLSIGRMLP
jgi:uncharacterized protein